MAKAKANAVVGAGGGPTAVINQSVIGVTNGLLTSGSGFTGIVFGAHHGSEGMRDWDVENLNRIPMSMWEKIGNTPAAYLGSTRDKPDENYCVQMFDNFKGNNVRYVFYIGGNDSANTAYIIHKMAEDAKYEIFIFHIAKTVDNDLWKGDHSPGFPTAAKYDIYTLADLVTDAATLPSIILGESMGRDAGHLASSAALVNEVLEGGKVDPLIYVPEVAVPSLDIIADQAIERYKRDGIAVVMYSEGIRDNDGKRYKKKMERLEEDARSQVRLSASPVIIKRLQEMIKERGEYRVVPHMFGYPQRCSSQIRNQVDRKEAFDVGIFAAKLALGGKYQTGSVGLEAERDPEYKATPTRWDLKDVEGKAKPMGEIYLKKEPGQINVAEYAPYLKPLLGSLKHKLVLNSRLLKNRSA